jgi:hypothetical protein
MNFRIRFLLPVYIFFQFLFYIECHSQGDVPQVVIPTAILISNYNRIPVGLYESAEGGAAIARSNGLTATWYNPAGISLTGPLTLSANYSGYEMLRLTLDKFSGALKSLNLDESPGLFSVVFRLPFKAFKHLNFGISLGNSVSWQPIFDSQAKLTLANGMIETITLSSQSAYSTYIPSFSVAWTQNSTLRFGASIGAPYTDLTILQSISDDLIRNQTQHVRIVNTGINGNSYQLLATLGTQWEPLKNVILGLIIRSPGIQIIGNGSTSYTSSYFNSGTFTFYSQRDNEAQFRHKIPFTIAAGSAFIGSRWEIEADILFYGGLNQFTIIKTDEPINITTSIANISDTISSSINIPPLKYSARYLINGAIGTRVKLYKSLRLHGGLFTDLSPMISSSEIFKKINMVGGTIGLSLTGKAIAGGAGIRGSFGKSEQFTISNLLDVEPFQTRLNITSFAFIWSLALGI